MKNPWEEIKLDDYESHMKLDSVMQLQTMNNIMKEQFYQYPIKTIMILGIAGGNGLEHINSEIIDKVFAIDINQNYLIECKKRYSEISNILNLICTDLINDVKLLPHADLVVANLLIEYIGYEAFKKVILKVKPEYISCVIQINNDTNFVSNSPYIQSFQHLDEVHHQMDEKQLVRTMASIYYNLEFKKDYPLPNGKKLVRLDFKYVLY